APPSARSTASPTAASSTSGSRARRRDPEASPRTRGRWTRWAACFDPGAQFGAAAGGDGARRPRRGQLDVIVDRQVEQILSFDVLLRPAEEDPGEDRQGEDRALAHQDRPRG